MKIGKGRIFLPEIRRWLISPFFCVVVLLSSVLIVMDAFASVPIGNDLRDGYIRNAVDIVIGTSGSGFLKFVGLCLCTLPAAGMYAEDYGENAVYMRVQRLGMSRYVFGRIMDTVLSAWLCGFLAEVFCMVILVVVFGQEMFPSGNASFLWMESTLLEQGRNVSFCFIMAGICGFRAVFYALMAQVFSVFVPDRRAVAAVPLLLYYFNQYMLSRASWLPLWLKPSIIYTKDNMLSGVLGISEWQGFLVVTAYTAFLAVLVFILLRTALYKNRIFGGSMG